MIGILYGALLAIGQTDLKRLIAYTSIAHFGFIVLGIFAMTTQGQSGSTLYMVNHGFSTAALFLIAGFLISRRGSRLIADFGGVQRVAPMLAGTFLVAGLSSLALPGLSSFVSEFLVLVGTFTRYQAAAVDRDRRHHPGRRSTSCWMYQRTMTGEPTEAHGTLHDLNAAGGLGRGAAAGGHHRARLLPQAAARRHQPGGRAHHAPGRRHRPRPLTPAAGNVSEGAGK